MPQRIDAALRQVTPGRVESLALLIPNFRSAASSEQNGCKQYWQYSVSFHGLI